MEVIVDGVSVTIDDAPILHGVSLEVTPNRIHGLIGPNGSGKSTLLRCIYRALRPTLGAVSIGADDLWRDLSARQAAQRRAVVTQDHHVEFAFAVGEIVMMGRAPHKGVLARDNRRDAEIVERALEQVGMAWSIGRSFATLSGGERQRVLVARALAQEAPVLVLDEPTNHLDVRSQVELLELVGTLGLTTLVALHDLDHAAGFCDSITVLQEGRVVASGPSVEVLTVERIRSVFGVDAHIGTHPLTGRPHVTTAPLRSSGNRPATDPTEEGSAPCAP